ncbi:MAG: hypothetical protein R3310_09820, partial [Candidatus Competibacteraceae bacterium]|nr:hypothetical protein [Candidatus Competibacteraceae bacterium]
IGEDIWQYRYFVDNHVFAADEGFTLFFDTHRFGLLQDPPPAVNADWDLLVYQPDEQLGDDGLYDALALTNDPSLDEPFILSFIWRDAGSPGSQPFVLYGSDFQTLASGLTVPLSAATPMPLPPGGLLLGLGLAGLAIQRRLLPVEHGQRKSSG